jgi:hypothetical protein
LSIPIGLTSYRTSKLGRWSLEEFLVKLTVQGPDSGQIRNAEAGLESLGGSITRGRQRNAKLGWLNAPAEVRPAIPIRLKTRRPRAGTQAGGDTVATLPIPVTRSDRSASYNRLISFVPVAGVEPATYWLQSRGAGSPVPSAASRTQRDYGLGAGHWLPHAYEPTSQCGRALVEPRVDCAILIIYQITLLKSSGATVVSEVPEVRIVRDPDDEHDRCLRDLQRERITRDARQGHQVCHAGGALEESCASGRTALTHQEIQEITEADEPEVLWNDRMASLLQRRNRQNDLDGGASLTDDGFRQLLWLEIAAFETVLINSLRGYGART